MAENAAGPEASVAAATAASPVLEVQELVHRFGDRTVLGGLSFSVAPGEIFGLLGPNGAGKTTAFAILTGLLAPSGGELRLEGRPMRPGDRRLRVQMGVVFQTSSLDAKLTARENLLLGARLYRLPTAVAHERVQELLAFADLTDRASEPVGRYSGGMRRRLEIARALVHAPKILVMDEPTAGLDEASFQRTWARLHGLRQSRGLTILLTTHRPEEAERCDRLAILHEGRIRACESPEKLRERVSGDVIIVEGEEPEALARTIEERFGLCPRAIEAGRLQIERERGHELIPRLVEAFPPGRLRAISLRRPGLADAFLKLTGQALEEDLLPT